MPTASWNQLERAIEHLHAAAREPRAPREFYRQLVAEAIAALDAAGAAAWRSAGGRPELIAQTLPDDGVEADWSARSARVEQALRRAEPTIVAVDGRYDALLCPTPPPAAGDEPAAAVAVIELWLPRGASPPVQQGWCDFAAALADVAADFHARDELRRLRDAGALRRQAVALARRVAGPRTLAGAAFEAANEGRRLLGCDRVSVVARRGRGWRLLAASGVDAAERRTQFARSTERLADEAARWGEPLEFPAPQDVELPPRLAAALEEHVDHSHARTVACVPIKFPDDDDQTPARFDLALVAERFDAGPALREVLAELGELCAPALARATELDRFPVNLALRWSQRLARLREPTRLVRTLLVAALLGAAAAALAFVPADFTIEAPARMTAVVERDVFATASGAVAEVRVTHGQTVAEGDVLLVLRDPELALKLQEVRGEIDAGQKRLDAMAVTRTDRALREDARDDRLPLSAEQRELEERLVGLRRQLELLERRREALTLRSPSPGQVITRDVQTLLESRPVERGQALLTVADVTSGWELRADVPQRDIGHVLQAQESSAAPLAANYRLVSDVDAVYAGHVASVGSAAPLDAEGLRDDAEPVEVRIAVDGAPPQAARPGMNATVRIHCGRRSLGYVWLHDAAATLYRWATF